MRESRESFLSITHSFMFELAIVVNIPYSVPFPESTFPDLFLVFPIASYSRLLSDFFVTTSSFQQMRMMTFIQLPTFICHLYLMKLIN